jgi:hypothetical protein
MTYKCSTCLARPVCRNRPGDGVPMQARVARLEELNSCPHYLSEDDYVVRPCHVGQIVYKIKRCTGGKTYVAAGSAAVLTFADDNTIMVKVRGVGTGEVGKDIFLTYAAAEAARKMALKKDGDPQC